ncbi:MAG: signal peptide peptidase SppA [Pseudomonadota bacterium]
MATEPGNGVLARIGRGLTRLRTFTLNALFVLLLLVLITAVLSDDVPVVPDDSALLINPRGVLVEQRSYADPLGRLLAPDEPREIELSEITEALKLATDDTRIRLAVLDFDELGGMTAGQAAVIGEAVRGFQAADKEVIAYGASFGQSQYLLASYADALYMHPMGQLLLPGYGANRLYFKELLDKIQINLHIFRAGKYKEFVEPYLRTDMSEEAREANQSLVDELWDFYRSRIVQNRELDPGLFRRYTQNLPEALGEMGDLATAAVEHSLVDELLNLDEVRARIATQVGYGEDGEFRRIGFENYLRAQAAGKGSGSDPIIAVLTAEGPIMMGRQSQGVIAADTVSNLIRQARQDENVEAVVVRVSSPGGSAFASEMIRQELELLQLAGKPVVVSMGNVAASGGYWISATADRILANPTTVTGSIGVFGVFPTFEGALETVGVTSDGVGTTPLSGAADPFSGLSDDMAAILQLNTEHTYSQFVNLVARGRNMAPEAVDAIAQGRVWTGARAKALGLVDDLGGLDDAVAIAAELADLESWRTEPLRAVPSPREMLLSSLGGIESELKASGFGRVWSVLNEAEAMLKILTDPQHGYALCEVCLGPGGPVR